VDVRRTARDRPGVAQRAGAGGTCPVGRTAAIHSAPPSSASTTSAISSRRGQDSEAIDPGTVCRVREGAGLGAVGRGCGRGRGCGLGFGLGVLGGLGVRRVVGVGVHRGREQVLRRRHPNGLDTEGIVSGSSRNRSRREPSARRWRGASVSVSRCGVPVSPSWCARGTDRRLGRGVQRGRGGYAVVAVRRRRAWRRSPRRGARGALRTAPLCPVAHVPRRFVRWRHVPRRAYGAVAGGARWWRAGQRVDLTGIVVTDGACPAHDATPRWTTLRGAGGRRRHGAVLG